MQDLNPGPLGSKLINMDPKGCRFESKQEKNLNFSDFRTCAGFELRTSMFIVGKCGPNGCRFES